MGLLQRNAFSCRKVPFPAEKWSRLKPHNILLKHCYCHQGFLQDNVFFCFSAEMFFCRNVFLSAGECILLKETHFLQFALQVKNHEWQFILDDA